MWAAGMVLIGHWSLFRNELGFSEPRTGRTLMCLQDHHLNVAVANVRLPPSTSLGLDRSAVGPRSNMEELRLAGESMAINNLWLKRCSSREVHLRHSDTLRHIGMRLLPYSHDGAKAINQDVRMGYTRSGHRL